MKKILSYGYSLLLLLSALYLGYAQYQGIINYDYIRSFDVVFFLILIVGIVGLLLYIIFSTAARKKWYIIGSCLMLIILAELWLMDTAQFFGSDIIKLVSVLGVFLSLFGSLSQKKEFVKGEYTKKVEIIEA